jgi:hypothetical protein
MARAAIAASHPKASTRSAAAADLRILAATLRAEARRTYMEAFFAQEREAQFIELIRSVDELLGQAEALPGDIPRADVLEATTTRPHARHALEQAKFEHLAPLRGNHAEETGCVPWAASG